MGGHCAGVLFTLLIARKTRFPVTPGQTTRATVVIGRGTVSSVSGIYKKKSAMKTPIKSFIGKRQNQRIFFNTLIFTRHTCNSDSRTEVRRPLILLNTNYPSSKSLVPLKNSRRVYADAFQMRSTVDAFFGEHYVRL